MGIWGFRDLKPIGFCDQYTYSSISGIRVRINVGVHIMDYLITIHGPYFDYVYIIRIRGFVILIMYILLGLVGDGIRQGISI